MTCKRVYSGIGGQAVIEGIMMKSGNQYAVGVRKPDGDITVSVTKTESLADKYPILKWPIIRGVYSFVDSLATGMKTLTYSASFFEDEEGTEPDKFEQFLTKIFGDKTEKVIMGAVTVVAVILSIGIFMLLPMYISGLIQKVIKNYYVVALIEGFIRIGIFVAYIKLVSKMDDINRTFMYHGAEHKCINCVELGNPMDVEHVMAASKEHKRCGTSFLIIVMVISILFFMVVRFDNLLYRALSRIILVPVIAGLSYEFLRIAGRSESKLINILSKPGMWMQELTTKEPTTDMAEVAIAATEAVFDWRKFLKDNFGKDYPYPEPEVTSEPEDENVAEESADSVEPENNPNI